MNRVTPVPRKARLIVVGVFLLLTVACTMGSSYRMNASHFAYPNSNVIPLTEIEGSSSRVCGLLIFAWSSTGVDDVNDALEDALLSQSGADLIVDATVDSGVLMIPPFVTLCQVRVRGTAASMEVGMQQLSESEHIEDVRIWQAAVNPE